MILLSHVASPHFPTLIKIASRFIELICYDFLLLSICMFFVHFCVLPYVLAGFQHMQSSQLPSVSFLCFVFFRDCFVKEGKQEQEKLKS